MVFFVTLCESVSNVSDHKLHSLTDSHMPRLPGSLFAFATVQVPEVDKKIDSRQVRNFADLKDLCDL